MRKVGQRLDRCIELAQRFVVALVSRLTTAFQLRQIRFGDGPLEERCGVVTLTGDVIGHRPTRPSTGLLAVAYMRRVMRPAPNASRPASTASRIARAIATGSCAPAMAVFINTPSAPSSIAIAASDAVPTPASTITGTCACALMMRMLFGF